MSAPQILVVGAGPTGLMLALELAAAGVAVRIIDSRPEPSDKSRALVVHARTLELLDRHRLAQPLIELGRTTLKVRIQGGAREFPLVLSDIGAEDTAFPFLLFVSQVETERVLEQALNAHGVQVERGVTLTSVTRIPDGALASLRVNEALEQGTYRYVVGCDGAHSTVRKGAGLSFEGGAYEQQFVLADVDVQWNEPLDELRFFLGREGLMVFFPMKRPGHYRIITTGDALTSMSVAPSLEILQQKARRMTGRALDMSHPVWISLFRLHHRGVDRYRSGPLFVAGDAAHIHSPAGGQGMNTGIQDAVNLGWKLAEVVRGRAPDSFLDSYHDERWPVGQRLLQFTDRVFSVGSSRRWPIAQLRDFVFPRLAPRVLSSRSRRQRAFRFVSQLGIRYRQSSIVREELLDADDEFRAGPRAGDRAPDAKVISAGGEVNLLSRMRAVRHHLLAFGILERPKVPDDWEVIPVLGTRVDGQPGSTCIDPSGEVFRRYGVKQEALVLVRPDGYIAFRSNGKDVRLLQRYLARSRA